MNIYQPTTTNLGYLPYTYRIGWSPMQTGEEYWIYYYGCKYGQDAHPDRFWRDYFTSSETVKEKRLKWGEPALKEIRKKWKNIPYCKESALKVVRYESRALGWIGVVGRKDYLNKHNGGSGFSNEGMKFYNNGKDQGWFFQGMQPDGWRLGRQIPCQKQWFTDGETNMLFVPGEEPSGWISGKKEKGTICYNNGEITLRFVPGEQPLGWEEGRLPSETKWFTDGTESKRCVPGAEPLGWKPGKAKSKKKMYTNGKMTSLFIPGTEPNEWKLGRHWESANQFTKR